MRIRTLILLSAILVLGLTGCNQANGDKVATEKSGNNTYMTVKANEEGNLIIDTSQLSEDATFVNYTSEGDTTIQLIAVKASDGSVRTTFNTCQSCNPSPLAYFVQEDDTFICQNCKNVFMRDQVGVQKGGCNPANIEEKTEKENSVIIPAAYLDQYAGNFANWDGPTE